MKDGKLRMLVVQLNCLGLYKKVGEEGFWV